MAVLRLHTTTPGDRFDLIAHRYYGDANLFSPIIESNPLLAIWPILPAGLIILVPEIDTTETPTEDLPPWKR